jgi:hypothetical protein
VEAQKLKDYLALLPPVQYDSEFLVKFSSSPFLYACGFRNKSEPLNQGKNMKYFFYS